METIFNFSICIHEPTLPVLLVVFPHPNVVITTGVNVSAEAMLKLFVELALINVEILSQVSAYAFPFVLRIQLPDVAHIINFQLTESQI